MNEKSFASESILNIYFVFRDHLFVNILDQTFTFRKFESNEKKKNFLQ